MRFHAFCRSELGQGFVQYSKSPRGQFLQESACASFNILVRPVADSRYWFDGGHRWY